MTGAIRVRETTHVIDGQTIGFVVLAPTIGDPTTREVTAVDKGGNTAVLRFGHDDFQLFKSILKEF